VAYALFKKAIREEARSGIAQSGDKRNPSQTTIRTYRAAAEQLLTDVVGRAIDEATPEIQQSAVLKAIESSQAKVEAHITKRTNFGSSLTANFVAWLISLAVAAMILFVAARPSVEETIADVAQPNKLTQPEEVQ
jgi:hypothetical protein